MNIIVIIILKPILPKSCDNEVKCISFCLYNFDLFNARTLWPCDYIPSRLLSRKSVSVWIHSYKCIVERLAASYSQFYLVIMTKVCIKFVCDTSFAPCVYMIFVTNMIHIRWRTLLLLSANMIIFVSSRLQLRIRIWIREFWRERIWLWLWMLLCSTITNI